MKDDALCCWLSTIDKSLIESGLFSTGQWTNTCYIPSYMLFRNEQTKPFFLLTDLFVLS